MGGLDRGQTWQPGVPSPWPVEYPRPLNTDVAKKMTLCDITTFSNKKCAHSLTHDCPFLADSNSSLCAPCAVAVANGQPCA